MSSPTNYSAEGVTLLSQRYGDVLTGGAGADTLSGGQGPDKLTGGAGADLFVYKAMPWNGGQIADFQVGVDRLDISALYANGYAGSDPIADGYVRFESNGSGGTKVMLDVDGPDSAAVPWSFHVATLDGIAPAGLTSAQVFGGPASAAGLTLASSRYADVLTGGAGADTLIAGQGPDDLTGGAGADRFVFTDQPWAAGRILDFKAGVDLLDLSGLFKSPEGADPEFGGYVRFESNGAGGTKVLVDADGPGADQPFFKLVTVLEGVAPGGMTSASVIGGVAPTSGLALASTGYGDRLVGGAGADTLFAGQGPDVLTGGPGADRFVFKDLPWNAGHVTDFGGGDVIDFSALFRAAGYHGADPIADGYLRLEAGVGGTVVLFDSDAAGQGQPWATRIAVLDGVSPSDLEGNAWFVA